MMKIKYNVLSNQLLIAIISNAIYITFIVEPYETLFSIYL